MEFVRPVDASVGATEVEAQVAAIHGIEFETDAFEVNLLNLKKK